MNQHRSLQRTPPKPRVKRNLARALALAMTVGTASLVSGCDLLLDHALDCLDDDGPEFDRSILAAAVLNQPYNEEIIVKINNEPRDDSFRYDMNMSGDLPPGITGNQGGESSRRWFLRGTPTETGSFTFRLLVTVDEPGLLSDEDSGLCYTTRSKDFELTVLEQ